MHIEMLQMITHVFLWPIHQ